jgi:hypothetical protein
MDIFLKSTAARVVGRGYLSADHISTIMISKNGGNFANPAAGASIMTEIEATGWYYFALGTADVDTLGPLIIRGTHATMDNIEVACQVVETVTAVNLTQILGHLLTQTGAQVADAFQKFFDVAAPTATCLSLPDAVPGQNGGLPTTNGTKVSQTVDLTASQSIACSDKTGFSLSATGADLILKSSTFVQAIVAAINELATYGLTALNTLLVTTGIKSATVPALVAADVRAAVGLASANLDTQLAALPTDADVNAACDAAISDAAIPAAAAALVLVTPAQKIETDINGHITSSNAGSGATAEEVRIEMDANSTKLAAIVEDTGTTLPAQIAAIPSAAGAGSTSWSYTLTNSITGLPIDGADVWVTTDSAGANIIASGMTNSAGVVTFLLNTGLTLYVWRKKAGFDFTNPDQEAT